MMTDNNPEIRKDGIRLNTAINYVNECIELLSSMRFSIALLMLIAVASIIGTVVEQNKPWVNYVNQFGTFWAELFKHLGVLSVYNSVWFLAVMTCLVVSLTLCLIRNTPKIIKDIHHFKHTIGRKSIMAHHHKGFSLQPASLNTVQTAVELQLKQAGYQFKLNVNHINKDNNNPTELMIAAKKGLTNRWGYILAHGGMVIILVGGVLDSELPLKLIAYLNQLSPIKENVFIKEAKPNNYLPINNPSYRGNVLIPEGATTRNAMVNYDDGVLVQPIPFDLTLKQFKVDYYSTGMPKLFSSDVIVHDRENNTTFERTIKVNEPLSYQGVTVYQSSFDDGGSVLNLNAYPLSGDKDYTIDLNGRVGEFTTLQANNGLNHNLKDYRIEFSSYRPINVEDLSNTNNDNNNNNNNNNNFNKNLNTVLGVASPNNKHLRNVGASVQYKLRDSTGQAKEFHAYQYPIVLNDEKQAVFLLGMRDNPSDGFKFVRFPADKDNGLSEYMRFRAGLSNPAIQQRAATAFAKRSLNNNTINDNSAAFIQLKTSAEKALSVFSGIHSKQATIGGFTAIATVIDSYVKKEDAQQAATVILKVLTGVAWDVWQQARVEAGLPVLTGTPADEIFLQTALSAYSDSFFLDSPIVLHLEKAEHKQASVFQITKSPGQYGVYLGALCLVLGVFAMFYIKERRLWVWLRTHNEHNDMENQNMTELTWALSSPKRDSTFNEEYQQWQSVLGDKMPKL